MKRYHITLGASTTAGGVVTSASSHCSINGVRVAVEGDKIVCPACKSEGRIQCVGPRIPESWDGKPVALQDDLCICKCASPPRLLPKQALKCQSLDMAPADAAIVAERETADVLTQIEARVPRSDAVADELPVRFVHELTGKALARQPYRLEFSGKVLEGITDADGCTSAISAADRADLVAWHVAGGDAAA